MIDYKVEDGEISVKPANDTQARAHPTGACSARWCPTWSKA